VPLGGHGGIALLLTLIVEIIASASPGYAP
jgi:hypothetical protein